MTLINKMNGLIYKLENNNMSFVDTNPVKAKTLKLRSYQYVDFQF